LSWGLYDRADAGHIGGPGHTWWWGLKSLLKHLESGDKCSLRNYKQGGYRPIQGLHPGESYHSFTCIRSWCLVSLQGSWEGGRSPLKNKGTEQGCGLGEEGGMGQGAP